MKRAHYVAILVMGLALSCLAWVLRENRRICDAICNRGQCACAETCPLHRGQP